MWHRGKCELVGLFLLRPDRDSSLSPCKYEEKSRGTFIFTNGTIKILAILDEVEDHRETRMLSQSDEFKKLVKTGLDDVKLNRIKPWKEVRNKL